MSSESSSFSSLTARLILLINLSASRLLCDAPGPRVQTLNLCPSLLVCSHLMLELVHLLLPLSLLWLQSCLVYQYLCIRISLQCTWSTCSDTKMEPLLSNSSEVLSLNACSL